MVSLPHQYLKLNENPLLPVALKTPDDALHRTHTDSQTISYDRQVGSNQNYCQQGS